MRKYTDDHHTQPPLAGGIESFAGLGPEHLRPGHNLGPDLDAPEPIPASDPHAPRFYPYAEVAKMFGRSTRTVRLWVASGRLKAIKIGAAPFIPDAEIQRLQRGGEG